MRKRSRTTETPHAKRCVQCGHEFDVATAVGGLNETPYDAVPEPGAVTFCIGCGKAYQFADDLSIKPVDLAELLKHDAKQLSELRRVQSAIILARGIVS